MTLSQLLREMGSQEQAAERVGVAQTTISAWRRGHAFPRRLAIRALASATGRPIAEIEAVIAADRAARLVAPVAENSDMGPVPCSDSTSAPVGAAQ